MEKCPVCDYQITEKNIKDCGYSNFNVGHIECPSCNFKIKYNCLEKKEDYEFHWNKDIKKIKKILSLSEKEKNDLLKYFILNKTEIMLTEFDNFNKILENKDTVSHDQKILKENNIDLKITAYGEILMPKELEKTGIKNFIINTLKLKSKIKII